MTLEQTTTHIAETVDLLIDQFKSKDNWKALLDSYSAQIQEIEDVCFQLLLDRAIATAIGAQLDILGKIVGRERDGKTDAVYRLYIRAQILVNISSGAPEELIHILDVLITNTFEYFEIYPAFYKMVVSDEFADDPDEVGTILGTARSAGVGGHLEYTLVDDDYTFTFADADVVQNDGVKGFAGDQTNDELVLNWDFDTWAAGDPANWTETGETGVTKEITEVASGNGHGGGGVDACNFFSSIGGDLSLKQSFATTAGDRYQLRMNISLINSGQLDVKTMAGDFTEVEYTTIGEKIIDFTALGVNVEIELDNHGADLDITVDDVSVIPLGGLWADVVEA